MPTAIFVDAGFFLKRFPKTYRDKDKNDPAVVSKTLHEMSLDHLTQSGDGERKDLYRIFVYDCPPYAKKATYAKSKQPIDFGETPDVIFRLQLQQELMRLRKVVLRLGRIDCNSWQLKGYVLRELVEGARAFDELTDDDFELDVRQKGVDMKIGLDIASVAYKKQADQIVLVAGDTDFVPAAKLARREGIDFILDPMWASIPHELHEHIDGLRSTCPRTLTLSEQLRKKKETAEKEAEKETAPAVPESQGPQKGSSGDSKVTVLTFG